MPKPHDLQFGMLAEVPQRFPAKVCNVRAIATTMSMFDRWGWVTTVRKCLQCLSGGPVPSCRPRFSTNSFIDSFGGKRSMKWTRRIAVGIEISLCFSSVNPLLSACPGCPPSSRLAIDISSRVDIALRCDWEENKTRKRLIASPQSEKCFFKEASYG
jgi:hypothetical protein